MWFLILVAACGSDPEPTRLPEPVMAAMAQALPPELAQGREAFRAHCTACHGLHARGDGPADGALDVPDLAALGHDAERLARIVRDGVGGTPMRGFRGALEEAEIEAIAGWLASLEAE